MTKYDVELYIFLIIKILYSTVKQLQGQINNAIGNKKKVVLLGFKRKFMVMQELGMHTGRKKNTKSLLLNTTDYKNYSAHHGTLFSKEYNSYNGR